MSTLNLTSWPVAIPAAAAFAIIGVVGTSSIASAAPAGPGPLTAEAEERPAPETVPYFGIHPKITRDGVYVRAVVPDGPAAEAGIRSGDKIVSAAGITLDHRGAFRELLDAVMPGDVVTVVYERDGVEASVRVEVGSQADRPGPEDRPWFGAFPARPDGNPDTGLTVGYVSEGSPADVAGVMVGDQVLSVNGVDVTDPREAFASLRALSPGTTLVLEVARGGDDLTIAVVLGSQADNPNREEELRTRHELREERREDRRERREDRRDHRGEDGLRPGGFTAS